MISILFEHCGEIVKKIITPTIFPDRTSQVWKIDDLPLYPANGPTASIKIEWTYENEAECMHLFQLLTLLSTVGGANAIIRLYIAYFPYARQDKIVSNYNTFARYTFCKILDSFIGKIIGMYILDIHSDLSKEEQKFLGPYLNIRIPKFDIKEDFILYPDYNACMKYRDIYLNKFHNSCKKERNQLTGEIGKITCPDLRGIKSVALVDDICDGGSTFIGIAKQLKEQGVEFIKLYVTHGLFSKGKEVLNEAGINEIETADYEKFFGGEY